MINKIRLFYFNIFFSKFSVLAQIGDLSKYKYGEMSILLIDWNKVVEDNFKYRDVTWQNHSTLIKVRYDLNTDQYIQILAEEWKKYELKIVRNEIKI
jgi:hypothetical protein